MYHSPILQHNLFNPSSKLTCKVGKLLFRTNLCPIHTISFSYNFCFSHHVSFQHSHLGPTHCSLILITSMSYANFQVLTHTLQVVGTFLHVVCIRSNTTICLVCLLFKELQVWNDGAMAKVTLYFDYKLNWETMMKMIILVTCWSPICQRTKLVEHLWALKDNNVVVNHVFL